MFVVPWKLFDDGTCRIDSSGTYMNEQDCTDAINFSFDYDAARGCVRSLGRASGEYATRHMCDDAHRPAVRGKYPNLGCGNSSPYSPSIDNSLDSKNPAYLQCMSVEEFREHPEREYANANYSATYEVGKMNKWCDKKQDQRGEGACADYSTLVDSWCCAYDANTSREDFSGRCVYGAKVNSSPYKCRHVVGMTDW